MKIEADTLKKNKRMEDLSKCISNKRLIPKIVKRSLKVNKREQTLQYKNGQKNLNNIYPDKIYRGKISMCKCTNIICHPGLQFKTINGKSQFTY